MSTPSLLSYARQYHEWGYNVVPIDADKKPLVYWKSDPDWTSTRQTIEDILAMPWQRARGIAAVLGEISGDLRCIDFDHQSRTAVDLLLADLGLSPSYPWLVRTPGGGYHVWLRSESLLPGVDKVDRVGIHGGHTELRIRNILTTLPPTGRKVGRYEFVNGYPDGPPQC